MDLHSGTPFWPLRNGLLACFPPLEENLGTEVAVVGAGITGALVAHELASAGLACVVLDRRDVAAGSTAASTSILQYEIDMPLHRLAERIGEPAAARVFQLGVEAIDTLESLDRRLGGGNGFRRVESLQGASRRSHLGALRREAETRQRLGFDVELWDAARLRRETSLPYPGALLSRPAAEIDAHRLACALLRAASALGTRVHDRTAVTSVRRGGRGGFHLRTDRGHEVRARRLVWATGYETRPRLPAGLVKLTSTYALVTEPLARPGGWPEGRVVWETARPYHYLRRTEDGRVIIGGLDEPFRDPRRRDRLLPAKTAALARRLRHLLPGNAWETGYAWCGTFAETPDGLPHIGTRPDRPDVYYALGYGGNGITQAAVAARLLRELLVEGASPDAALFRLDRPVVRIR